MSFVLNPETSRMIKIGGKRWRELVKKGMIENAPLSSLPARILYEAADENEAKAAKTILSTDNQMSKKIGMKKNTYPSRKGNKVYEFKNRPRQEDIADFTAQAASRTIHKHMTELSNNLDQAYENEDDEELEDFEYKLKNLILQEMINQNVNIPPTQKTRIPTTKRKNNIEPDPEYVLGGDEYSGDDG